MIICAGEIESFDFATPIGIGLIDSAINLTELLSIEKPDELLFIGTAGSYGAINIFDLVVSSNAANLEHSFILNTAYSPIKNQIVSCETEPIINSSNYITTDEKIAKKYLKNGIDLENMEFYSVVKVAKKFDIKVKGVFVITNYCDDDAHEMFIKNHQKAKDMLKEYIRNRS